MNRLLAPVAVCVALAWGPLAGAQTISSTRLKGVIDKGYGSIDLRLAGVQSRNLTMAQLEAFRRDNGGLLAFAVDVNEAANGTEKSSSQGVAVEYARVEVTTGTTVTKYETFSTQTQSAVARAGSTTRSLWYTLIGDAGSRQVSNSSSDVNGSSFDATLRIPVSVDLSTAASARLVVKFLDTNEGLGAPEDFYDYSNGFEDVAIVTVADAQYLDQVAPGRTEAPLVLTTTTTSTAPASRLYFPSSDEFYVAAYEDQFPSRGDYDFNDLVVAYRVYYELDSTGKAVVVGGEGYLVARGGGFDSDWHLRLALPSTASGSGNLTVYKPDELVAMSGFPRNVSFTGPLDLEIFAGTTTLWQDGSNAFVNTLKDQSLIRGHRFTFSMKLGAALDTSQLPEAPFDPYLFVKNTGYEIHLQGKAPVMAGSLNSRNGKTSFVDSSGYPFALILPQSWQVPVEYIDLGIAYQDFLSFVGGDTAKRDWYMHPSPGRTKATAPTVWKW